MDLGSSAETEVFMMDRAAAAQHSSSHCPDSSHPGDITFHGDKTVRRVTTNQPGSRITCEAGNSEIKCRRGIEYLMSTRTCHHCHQALFMDPLCVPITNTNGRHLQSYYYHHVMFIVYSELAMRPHNRDIKLVMAGV